mmetsp:Transcript_2947/g.8075  ORF Transcript_2947/g.8075 Transcript_2947/m.8075 type:complete len:253 (+) Transcript_2947:262-1020(+)
MKRRIPIIVLSVKLDAGEDAIIVHQILNRTHLGARAQSGVEWCVSFAVPHATVAVTINTKHAVDIDVMGLHQACNRISCPPFADNMQQRVTIAVWPHRLGSKTEPIPLQQICDDLLFFAAKGQLEAGIPHIVSDVDVDIDADLIRLHHIPQQIDATEGTRGMQWRVALIVLFVDVGVNIDMVGLHQVLEHIGSLIPAGVINQGVAAVAFHGNPDLTRFHQICNKISVAVPTGNMKCCQTVTAFDIDICVNSI